MPYELDQEWYDEQYKKGCAVTNIPFDPVGSKSPWTAHIDRVLPDEGYTKNNCRLVCACYNLAKKNWSDDDVLTMARKLVQHKKII